MVIEIDPNKLKQDLIYVYECYLSSNTDLNKIAYEKAQDMDGLWSGDFLLKKSIEQAIGGLRYIYLEPKLPKLKANKILLDLKNEK